MAVKLPKYTWASTQLTLQGSKQVVYSTVTGDIVGEIRDGKFVQTAEKIPVPTKKAPRTVSVPSTARLGGTEVAIANLDRDLTYYQSIAEDINSSATEKRDALNQYNTLQKERARLEGEAESLAGAGAKKSQDKERLNARQEFDRLKSEYQTLQRELDALINRNSNPRTPQIQGKMFDIVSKAAPLYKTFSGQTLNVEGITSILAGGRAFKTTEDMGAPTGTSMTETPASQPATPSEEPPVTKGKGVKEPAPGFDKRLPGLKPTQLPMPVGDGKGKTKAPIGGNIMAQAEEMYGELDDIFASDPELKKLLETAVKKEYTESRFLSELERTNWWKSNAGPIRQRGFYKRQYDDLVNEIKTNDPNYQSKLDELNRTSEYGRGLENAVETVTAEWTSQYGTPSADDLITIRTIADNLYQYANENDVTKIRNAVLSKPKTLGAGRVAGGALGANLQTLRSIASANGLDLDRDFGTSVQTWMDRIAKGESIETIKSVIRNTAKNTWGVNDRIAGLLDQGVDLATIYAPYKERMKTILEISPETITFADLAAKGVIGGKEEKNLYEFEKELRKDPRWQYTRNAATDVSNSALQVLKDFGFQG